MKTIKRIITFILIAILLPIKTVFYFILNCGVILLLILKLSFFEPELFYDKLNSLLKS